MIQVITSDSDGNKIVHLELPLMRIQRNNDGDLVIKQEYWNVFEEQWEENTVWVPKEFIDIFVNTVCDIVGVM